MNKATPPPWRFEDGLQGAFIRGPSGYVIARLYIPNPDVSDPEILDQMAANGTLIAAAPELLQACRHSLQLLWGLADAEDAAGRHNAALNVREVETTLTAAIAKARPEGVR